MIYFDLKYWGSTQRYIINSYQIGSRLGRPIRNCQKWTSNLYQFVYIISRFVLKILCIKGYILFIVYNANISLGVVGFYV